VRGLSSAGGLRFLGVPYAESPVTAGRFGPPRPHPGWDGTRAAVAYGATAPQPDRGVTIIPEPLIPGEEYLNLNIFTPALDAALPVLVWIHGGGFFGGCNASPWYDGARFARDGVVLVSIGYRLGAEGFLALPDAPANRGLLDCIAALEWVRENIGAFGGDPGRVTIAGQSAGGAACAALLAAPAAAGLFRGAICMSGAGNLMLTADDAARAAKELAAALAVRAVRADLEQVPADRLVRAQQEVAARQPVKDPDDLVRRFSADAQLRWAPFVDGTVLSASPLGAVGAGRARDIPIMAGTTANEFNMALADAAWITAETVRAALLQAGQSPGRVDEYLRDGAGQPGWQLAGQALTDRTFRIPARELAGAQAAAGGTAYTYEFRWAPPDGPFAGQSIHCLAVPFVFDNLDADGVEVVAGPRPPQDLADAMHRAWVRFVTEGTPGWEPRAGQPTVMIFDDRPRTEQDPLAA
jgi:para-nitrobenzyl esterase